MARKKAAKNEANPKFTQDPHSVKAEKEKNLEIAIGHEVRRLRKKLGLTVADLGQATGISVGMLSKIENGNTSASLATLQALSRALGVPMTRRETDAIAHHGRYAAWLMGIKQDWLFDSTAEGIRLLMHSASTQPRGEETSRIMAQSLAAEPLTREYPHFQTLRRKIEHSKHLSISRLYLSRKTLDKLGVPSNVLPWYPLLTIGPRFMWQTSHRLLPGGYRRLTEQGYRKQLKMLEVFHAGARSAAGLIQPDADHPAHV